MSITRRHGLGLAAGMAGVASAQTFPDRPIRWLVGYPPGGAADVLARLVGGQMASRLGQNVVVENRPGGGAVLASEAAARSPADGHTWLHVDNGVLVYNPALYSRLPMNPDTDFAGVGFIGRFPLYLVVRADNPWRSFAEYRAAAATRAPNYGTPAVASPHHIAMEMVKRRTGLDATHVPFRGGPASLQELLSGSIESVVVDTATGRALMAEGRIRALCVLSETRSPLSPDVPTLRELGWPEGVAYGWQGMSVPAATPAPLIARLSATMIEAIQSPEITQRRAALGIEYQPWSPAEFNNFVVAENAVWRPLIRELGIRLDG